MLSSDLRPFKSYESKKTNKKAHSLLERLDPQNAASFSKDCYDRVALVVRRLFLTCS